MSMLMTDQTKYPVPTYVSIHEILKAEGDLSDAQKESLYELLASGCRSKNRELLRRRMGHLSMLPHYGILGRLHVDMEREPNTFRYCAGQSYTDEMRTVRQIFLEMR